MNFFFGYIRIHFKSCIGKIILKELKVLLFFYFLNQKNISADEIKCLYMNCKNKKSHNIDVVIYNASN